MLAASLTLVILLAGQATAVSPTPVAPPVAETPATAEPATDPAAIAANLADMYEKSCGGRIYGTYAEACNGLAESLKQARAVARRAERAQAARLKAAAK